MSACVKRGSTYSCKLCNCARVAVIKAYKEAGQEHIWKKMNRREQFQEIKKNRNNSAGKGKKFPVEITERAADLEIRLGFCVACPCVVLAPWFVKLSFSAVKTLITEVDVSDSIALQKAKDYVNIRQFVKECRKRWGMKKDVAKDEWKTLLADPKVPKSEDERGWVTMPALSSVKSDPQILLSWF